MIYIHWAVLLAYTAIAVSSIISVLMDNKQPSKTMAWVLVLTFLPAVGIIAYFFFGRNTRRLRMISQRSLDQLSKRSRLEFVEQKGLTIPDDYRTLIRLFTNQSLSLPFKDNATDRYTNGHDFFTALLVSIANARHHIHLETYIIEDDPLGRLIADALIDKAAEGVEVRLIYDDVGCWKVAGRFFERMREAGIDVHAFMPVKFPAFTSKVNYRNHRKMCVIDGTTAFIGGMNIARRYVSGNGRQAWRDTHLRVRGGAVFAIQRAFLVDWYFVDRTLISNRKYYPPSPYPINNDCLAQVVTSSPLALWPDIMQGYVRILLEARSYVYIETPYFIPNEPVIFAMRTAAIAGVDIRLMVPRHSDARLVEQVSCSFLSDVIDAGVKVCLYEAGFNHSKLLVCDDSLCTCGSANFDVRSFENNFESNIFFYDRDMAGRMKQVFLDDMAHCTIIDSAAALPKHSFGARLWESFVRLMAPLM